MEKLSNQKVTIYGDHIGYQFSRTTAGKRTIKTAVFTDEIGAHYIQFRGRPRVLVVRIFPECQDAPSLFSIWQTVNESTFGALQVGRLFGLEAQAVKHVVYEKNDETSATFSYDLYSSNNPGGTFPIMIKLTPDWVVYPVG